MILRGIGRRVFTLDPCAPADPAHRVVPAEFYYTQEDDGLSRSWKVDAAIPPPVVFVNPPYSRISAWIDKCIDESRKGVVIVALVPSRTGTRWFERAVEHDAIVAPIPGRLRFLRGQLAGSLSPGDAAPFDAALLIWNPELLCLRGAAPRVGQG
ncbi:hypothetical protein BJI67_12950 [Acidihalobacter aeolianus]|uniref:Adenine methyltransferase n=2 Tax=Acidihalobacter aeolianus TaxID=2792603 RepID=A0A1D8KA48_9GAMM|nr:hypothetical protein BJI67_12950 [Acidihalobacter aeolianus]